MSRLVSLTHGRSCWKSGCNEPPCHFLISGPGPLGKQLVPGPRVGETVHAASCDDHERSKGYSLYDGALRIAAAKLGEVRS